MRRATAFAPGRVNIVGEHTDHSEGLALPFAIELGVTVTATPLPGRIVEAQALDLGESDRFERTDPGEPSTVEPGWRRFVRGAVEELARLRVRPPACRLEISGRVPRNAGLSSSAALSVALCMALSELANDARGPGGLELAELCARIERDWAGANTGLLDQLAAIEGREGCALRIDFRTLRGRPGATGVRGREPPAVIPVQVELRGHRLAVLPSGASRQHAVSGYNERRAECERARELLGTGSLRDADTVDWEALPEPYRRRVRHVLTENGRVDAMVAALRAGDLDEAGLLLDASHRSLRDDFEVSVPAVERTRERWRSAGALGARLMGGGFGGSVLALLPPGRALPPGALAVEPSGAARILPAT
jgi:galactokinase